MSTNKSAVSQAREPAWRTKVVKLGTDIKDARGFLKVIRKSDSGMAISTSPVDVLYHPTFTVAPEPTEVTLVVVSVGELGFLDGALLADIYASAKKRGLELCPPEVGPQLRLQYPDQPEDECLIIAMEPIVDANDMPVLFRLDYIYNSRCLNGYLARGQWQADMLFVFWLPGQ